MVISLAPLQGYTEFPFRNALANIIGGLDRFYTPYLRFENDGTVRSKHIKDILPENNKNIKVIPQILVNTSTDFLKMARIIEDFGYTHVNWNLGCPYPMVAKRQLGSRLLPMPERVNKILSEVIPHTHLNISIKLRSGYEMDTDINKLIEVFNQYQLDEIIYHPRVGKQLYRGGADSEKFAEISAISKHNLAYNGDIDTRVKYIGIQNKFPLVNHIMIGRGLIANPFLALEICEEKPVEESTKRKLFEEFHQTLFNHFSTELSGDSHLLNKFIHFWEYFSHLFVDNKRVIKTIKKSKTIVDFKTNAQFFVRNSGFASF
jgi:tRNA-dihydrouridine synthase